MKRLLILRHAKSDWGDSSLDDWQRPLSARGVSDAPRVGEMLRARALVPDLIITSDAVRACTTAETVANAAGYSRDIILEPSLYLATPDDIIAVLTALSDDRSGTVMIVGHNPGLEGVVQQLSGAPVALSTAALAHLVLPIDDWRDLDASIHGTLIEHWRPHG